MADYKKALKQALFNQFFCALPMLVATHYAMEWRTGGTYTLVSTWPSFVEFIFHFLLIVLVEEIGFYYTHRLAHHPRLYKHIHKKHHQYTAPIAISAVYCHPLEHLICNVGPIHLGPVLFGAHLSTCCAWYVAATLSTLNSHSGYHLPFFPSPEPHDFHHLKFNNNFGVLGLLDWIHGTDVDFRKSEQFKRHVVYFFEKYDQIQTTKLEEEQERDQEVKINEL